MSTLPAASPGVFADKANALGTKFFLICILAFGLSISGFFVSGLATERADVHGVLAASNNSGPRPPTLMGVQLADSYRAIYRSVHYIPLFIGLVFLTYFLFEVTTRRRVHPAQYALVGVAQIIFYLLLLSLAEYLGFDKSFLIAGASTVALFSLNAEWLFRSRKLAWRAFGLFTALYGFIYVLLRIEAFALLIGAVASFAAVAAAMFVTRNVDWYGSGPQAKAQLVAAGSRESWLD